MAINKGSTFNPEQQTIEEFFDAVLLIAKDFGVGGVTVAASVAGEHGVQVAARHMAPTPGLALMQVERCFCFLQKAMQEIVTRDNTEPKKERAH